MFPKTSFEYTPKKLVYNKFQSNLACFERILTSSCNDIATHRTKIFSLSRTSVLYRWNWCLTIVGRKFLSFSSRRQKTSPVNVMCVTFCIVMLKAWQGTERRSWPLQQNNIKVLDKFICYYANNSTFHLAYQFTFSNKCNVFKNSNQQMQLN